MQELKRLPGKKWYFTSSHNLCSDQEAKMEDEHWLHLYGLEWKCPCCDKEGKFYKPKIAKLVKDQFPHECVCQSCKLAKAFDEKECPYHKQFQELKTATNVMSPIQYAATAMFRDFEADYIVVDDCLLQKRDHPSLKKLEKYFHYAYYLVNKTSTEMTFLAFLNDPDFDQFISRLKGIRKDYLKGETIAVGKHNFNSISIDCLILYPEEFENYQKNSKLYGCKIQFATPYLFYLFDYFVENHDRVTLTVIDALPNQKFLNQLATRYELETSKKINFKFETIEGNFEDLGSCVHQILSQKGAWFSIGSSLNNDKGDSSAKLRKWIGDQISDKIDDFCRKFNHLPTIGFVTSKALYKKATKGVNKYSKLIEVSECEFIRVEWSIDAKQVLWYWNQRGMNTLEHCDLIFVVGTAVMNRDALVEEFGLWFPNLRSPSPEKIECVPHGGYYHYVDENLENFRSMKEEDEMYHAILRGHHTFQKRISMFSVLSQRK